MLFACKTAIVLLAIIHFLTPFLPFATSWLTFIAGIYVLLTSLFLMEKSFQKSSLVFLGAGVFLMVSDRQPLEAWITGLNSMLIVSSIVVIMQLFSIPIKAGNYHGALEYLLSRRMKKESILFVFTSAITHLFSSFLLMGTIPVMFSLLGDVLRNKVTDYERFMITSLTRSFSLVVLWAPGAVNILLALKATGAKWVEVFAPGLLLSVAGLATSYFIELKLGKISNIVPEGEKNLVHADSTAQEKDAWLKVLGIICVVAALIVLTALFEKLDISDSSTHRIMLAGITVVGIWILLIIRKGGLREAISDYWENGVNKVIDLSGLFAAMGIFSEALGRSTIMEGVRVTLPLYAATFEAYLPLIVPAVILILSMVGVHPYISIVLTGNIVTSFPISLSPHLLALALLIGGTVSYIISPFAGTVLVISRYMKRRPLTIVRENWVFSVLFLLEGAIIIYLMHIFI